MLKPSELKSYEFKSAGRNAYKADDVDIFFAEVIISYEKMYRENSELIKRISLLADRLEQYKNDEVDIKQAVLSAQKAADIIIRDAQESVEDSKAEAEAILAAAKGEAAVIKQDAEKQAIVDSDLLMNLAKDKAEDIINRAKEKAHGILIAANNSANDKMGAANRTITSESLHYDMLKKEVSEFRASILAQYKTHIELISKLPALAVEEAAKMEKKKEPVTEVEIDEEALENPVFVEEEPENSVLEFVADDEAQEEITISDYEPDIQDYDEEELEAGEDVIKTTLPFDFFGNEPELEFVDDKAEEAPVATIESDGAIGFSRRNPLPVEDVKPYIRETESTFEKPYGASESFSVDRNTYFGDASTDATNDFASYDDVSSGDYVADAAPAEEEDNNTILDEHASYASFFDSIENVEEDYDDDKPRHRGFFSRNK